VGDAPSSVTVLERQVISPDTVADAPGAETSAARTGTLSHSDSNPTITSNLEIMLTVHEHVVILKRFKLI
jgi:hypothetical protein